MKASLLIASAAVLGLAAIAAVPHPPRAPAVVSAPQPDGLAGMREKAAQNAEVNRMGAVIDRYMNEAH